MHQAGGEAPLPLGSGALLQGLVAASTGPPRGLGLCSTKKYQLGHHVSKTSPGTSVDGGAIQDNKVP